MGMITITLEILAVISSVMKCLHAATLLIMTMFLSAAAPIPLDDPVQVFAELDGVWAGTFVGYDESGRELYRIQVRQEYETIDANTQTVRVRDTMPDGTVITGEGTNIAIRSPDGTLQLTCIVNKSNGERVEHAGRLVKGPEGDEQIVWYSKATNRVETFREFVHHEGKQTIYEINGMGQYNDSLILMTGRYIKQNGN
ncbi:MAG: hypothetical protein O7G85_07515 [Planctomycetota bacterium]|nr:hypothetical protein [Planctomycetota bacterium]